MLFQIFRYSIAVQLVCDHNKKFISVHAGLPGSCHDSYVFKRMRISQEPEKYFDTNQYLLADSAYASGKYIIPAYRGGSNTNKETNNQFNYYLAQSSVRIEHAIGVLKGRWASLREMWSQLQTPQDMNVLIKWIICCIILHNLLADIKENLEELFEDDIPEICLLDFNQSSYSVQGIWEVIRPITLQYFNEHWGKSSFPFFKGFFWEGRARWAAQVLFLLTCICLAYFFGL